MIHGKEASPVILCVSGGAKDGIATTAVLNRSKDSAGASDLFVVSGEMDLARRDVFCLQDRKNQRELNAILGRAKRAIFPAFQPLRNAGASLKHRIADGRIEYLANHPREAYKKIVDSMSEAYDKPVLKEFPEFNQVVFEEIASYSKAELIDSIRRLFHWNIDFSALKDTRVHILHCTADTMVSPKNAAILQSTLRRAGVEQLELLHFPEGHLLLKAESLRIGKMIADCYEDDKASPD